VTTGAAVKPEKGPEFLKAEAKGVLVFLTWDKAGKTDTTYNIYRSTSPEKGFLKINKEEVKESAYTDGRGTSLTPPVSGKLYYYRITSVDFGVESQDSKTVLATPFAPLGPPDQITVLPGFSFVKIKWVEPDASGNIGVSGYNIYRSTQPGILARINPVTITAYEYDDAGLTNGARYDYMLQSVDALGNTSALSAVFSAVPFSLISSPKNLTTTAASSESIKLIWDAPDGGGTYGISGYNIYRSTQAGVFSDKPINEKMTKGLKTPENRLFYFDNMINSWFQPLPGNTYYYKIIPVDFHGNTGAASDTITGAVPVIEVNKQGIISADISEYGLPPESKLTLSGRKTLSMAYTHTWWKNNTVAQTEKFDITQKLKLNLKGNIGTKINVDVNYDEDTLTDEYTKISISYAGEKDETLQEVSFGDLTLDLPATRYLSYAPQKLFGIRGKAKIGDKLTITALAAQTKGINDTQVFIGKVRKKQTNLRDGVDIYDTAYIKNTYYYITRNVPLQKIQPGSLKIYRDDYGATLVDLNTRLSTPNNTYRFRELYSGVDFIVDYTTNVIKFNVPIADTNILAVGYKLADGTPIGLDFSGNVDIQEAKLSSNTDGTTDDGHHLIQNGTQTSTQADLSHRVLSYYNMGDTNINNPVTDTGGFKIIITKPDDTGSYFIPQPWEPKASDIYTIDTDFGILMFKSYAPFAKLQYDNNSPGAQYNGVEDGTQDDAYKSNAPKSLFKIHLNYNFNVSSYKLDNSPLVVASERVLINGLLKKKDADYTINYEAGEITFNKDIEAGITSNTEVKISYEYLPFVGATSSNLFGGRMDYALLDNLKLALTGLYKTSNAGTTVPDARSTITSLSTPYNSLVIDGNVDFVLNRENVNAIINALPLLNNSDLPVDFKFTAETAYSDLNPNVYQQTLSNGKVENGPAMIDDMESADITTSADTLVNHWFPASKPSIVTDTNPGNRDFMVRSNVTEAGNQPTSSDPTGVNSSVQMLKLNYSGLTDQKWDSFRFVLNSSGESLNQYNTLEIAVKVSTDQPVKMSLDVGIISEDSNGTGEFKVNDPGVANGESEDSDKNGILNTGEDIGIYPGIYRGFPGSTPAYWGAGNGGNIPDTEDMNNNTRLDMGESYYHFGPEGLSSNLANSNNIVHPELLLQNSDNWVDIKIPLKDYTYIVGSVAHDNIGMNKDQYMSFIKHLRINFKGSSATPASGTIKIQTIKFTGNSWNLETPPNESDRAGNPVVVDASKLNIESINQNILDAKKAPITDYTPNLDYFVWTTENDKKFETSLKMTYKISNLDQGSADNLPLYYATKSLNASGGYDFHAYKYLKMDVYYKTQDPQGGNGRVIFLRVGSGNNTDTIQRYYQYNEQLDDIKTGGWRTIVFVLDGSDGKRSSTPTQPNLRQAQYISVGFINPNMTQPSEVMYVNNIRLTDAQSSTGRSTFINTVMNVTGVGNLNHTYEDKEATFYTLADAGRADIKQHEISNNLSFNYTQLPFLPVTFNYFKNSKFLDGPNKNDPSYTQDNQVYDVYSEGYTNVVSFSLIPDLNISNGTTVRSDDYIYPGAASFESNLTKSMIFNPTLSWKAPANLFFIPLGSNNFDGKITFNNRETTYSSVDLTFTAGTSYYYNWRNDRNQDYKWIGAYSFLGISVQPSYEYMRGDEIGYLASKYVYYQDSITDPHYLVDKYYILNTQIMPKLSISYPDAWIFSPQINYNNEYRMDYTQSFLDNHGKLDVSTGMALKKLLGWMPGISRYSFTVESTQHFEEISYPGSFAKYNSMPFESRWNIFLWKMLGDEHEIARYETAAKNGAFIISHNLSLEEINIMSAVAFTPVASYSLNRTFYSQGAVRQFSEGFTLSANNININNVTIPLPFLQDLVSGQKVTGSYSYVRNLTKDTNKVITLDDITNNFSVQLPYASKNGLNGVFSLTGSRDDKRQGYLRSWSGTLTPSLTLNFKYRQTAPITFPSWLWLLGDKTFRMEQNLDLGINISVKYTMGGDNDLNINKANAKEYTLSTTAAYKILQNLTATLTMSYGHEDNSWKTDQEFDSFMISLGGVIEF
jgi:hypothetical protein